MINDVANKVAAQLGAMVNDDQISPTEVVIGASRAAIAFWMGCVQEGTRVDALKMLQESFEEEIANMVRGISNGQVPA